MLPITAKTTLLCFNLEFLSGGKHVVTQTIPAAEQYPLLERWDNKILAGEMTILCVAPKSDTFFCESANPGIQAPV